MNCPETPQSEWRAYYTEAIKPRLELIVALLLDSITIVVALLCRRGTLAAYHYATGGSPVPWHLKALEYILDYGIVATAIALVAFDLAKRVRQGWRRLFADKDATT